MMISLTAGEHMYVEVNCCEGMHEIAAAKARRLPIVPSARLHGECDGRCQVKGALRSMSGLTRVPRPCRTRFAIPFVSARFPKQ